MYKKISLVLAVLMCASFVVAQDVDQVNDEQTTRDSLGIHPWNDDENARYDLIADQAHWSLYVAAGFNAFDGDFTSEKKHAVWFPTVSLGGAYHWNNTWALGLEYKFRQYRVTGAEGHAPIMLEGMAHQGDFYLTFDIFNAFRPQNKRKLFALDLIVGGGAILKKNSTYYPNVYKDDIRCDFPYRNISASQTPQADEKYKLFGVFLGGVSAEFNINRCLQLGLRTTYNYTTTDQIDGRPTRGNNNDGLLDCELLLRYKFTSRRKSHVRNMVRDDERLAMAPDQMQDNGGAKGLKDTLYIITRDTVYMMGAGVGAGVVGAGAIADAGDMIKNYVVYFENDVPELDKKALSTTGEAAASLKQHWQYYALVIGSCDNTGAVEYNQWLAVQRANNVSKTLVDMGIEQDRIYTVGRGIMQDDRAEGSYSINRRAEIHLVTASEFEQAKIDYAYFDQYKSVQKGSAVRRAGEGKYASSSEALKVAMQKLKETGEIASIDDIFDAMIDSSEAVKTSVNKNSKDTTQVVTPALDMEDMTPSGENIDTVVIAPSMTLSKLARKYYNNTNMWVKIFEANRDVLSSPDLLEEGMILVIPKL